MVVNVALVTGNDVVTVVVVVVVDNVVVDVVVVVDNVVVVDVVVDNVVVDAVVDNVVVDVVVDNVVVDVDIVVAVGTVFIETIVTEWLTANIRIQIMFTTLIISMRPGICQCSVNSPASNYCGRNRRSRILEAF